MARYFYLLTLIKNKGPNEVKDTYNLHIGI